jgi:hypothetical protein
MGRIERDGLNKRLAHQRADQEMGLTLAGQAQ